MLQHLDAAVTFAASFIVWGSLVYFPTMFVIFFAKHVQEQVRQSRRYQTPPTEECHTYQKATETKSPQPSQQEKPSSQYVEFEGKEIRVYRYHQHYVVRIADLPFKIPGSVKQYRLRKQPVITLASALSCQDAINIQNHFPAGITA